MVDMDQNHRHHHYRNLVDKWNKNVWREVHQELVHYSQAMMVIENHRWLI
jgi:hypothetical protein